MRAILAVVLVLGACGDNDVVTVGDAADAFVHAAIARMAECAVERPTTWNPRMTVDGFVSGFCDVKDCDAEIAFDLDACLLVLDDLPCTYVGTPQDCDGCGFIAVPDECRLMWTTSPHG